MNIVFLDEISEKDNVGGKAYSLAKMYKKGFNVPNAFVITDDAFQKFLEESELSDEVNYLISNCNVDNEDDLNSTSNKIISLISKNELSIELKEQIKSNMAKLNSKFVAVRSSASSEDGEKSAWAGQLETFLNVTIDNIFERVKECWCSIFTPRAIFYKHKNNDISKVSMAVVVQEMIQSEISGVSFSVNPVENKNEVVIESTNGLGESLVSGQVTPDKYIVEKNQIVKKTLVSRSGKQILSDDSILLLADEVKKIEKFYGFPVDVEYAFHNNRLYIVQCRPITTLSNLEINKTIEKIKNAGDWQYYVSRCFNWYVESTEILSSMKKYQDNFLGFDVATQNYLVLNGDEYSLDSDFDDLCNIYENSFKADIDFFDKFAKKEFDIVEEVDKYIDELNSKEYSKMSFKQLSEELKTFNRLYVDSFIPGMTRPDDFLEKKLAEELKNSFSLDDVEFILKRVLTCPNYKSLDYSDEPLDLLQIALEKNNGKNIDKHLKNHINKYAWLKSPVVVEDTCFNETDYLNRIDNLQQGDINKKINSLLDVRKQNDIEFEKLLDKYSFSDKILKLINATRNFIFLRTYTTECSDHLFYIGRHTLFEEICKRCNLSQEDVVMLQYDEIQKILNSNGIISDEPRNTIEERKKGFAIIWINKEIKTYFGNQCKLLQDSIGNTYKNRDDSKTDKNIIKGNVANQGIVTGKVKILFDYNDTKKVDNGDIIVASMTTPDLVSAMEKASGFITDEGGITCHAAILSREFNVPCIVGTINATKVLKDGQMVELNAFDGIITIL